MDQFKSELNRRVCVNSSKKEKIDILKPLIIKEDITNKIYINNNKKILRSGKTKKIYTKSVEKDQMGKQTTHQELEKEEHLATISRGTKQMPR